MDIHFSKATESSFSSLAELYQTTIRDMRQRGLRQWEWGVYPSEALLEQDIQAGILYQAEEKGVLCAAFVISGEMESAYDNIAWHYGVKPATMHRLAMRSDRFGREMVECVLAFVKEEALRLACDCLRLDVSDEDARMLSLFRSHMLREAGSVYFENMGSTCTCFEEPLGERCPMLPIPMRPAFRFGEDAPWGGDQLRRYFRIQTPEERTGEALEVSVIPGLESVSSVGEPLSALLQRNGSRLTGLPAGSPFPLLLKLLAAREPLSVQVHPDDAYAKKHEGKLGKSEAWVILHAEEGAFILYGLCDGVTLEALRLALERDENIEPMLQRVPVKAGDVFYLPPGMVHAIGAGVTLYEIQQSSDVTYRLWDGDRANAKGEKRPLHLRQALDVVVPGLKGQRATLPVASSQWAQRLLDVPAFTLDGLAVNGKSTLPSAPTLRILTALAGLLLTWPGDAMELEAGDTVLLPAHCPELCLTGVGQALIAGIGG